MKHIFAETDLAETNFAEKNQTEFTTMTLQLDKYKYEYQSINQSISQPYNQSFNL